MSAIFVSACVALYELINRLVHPHTLSHLVGRSPGAGVVGLVGNELAAQVRFAGGRRLDSPALVVDGKHARVDGFVSFSVVASPAVVALGARVADPIIGTIIGFSKSRATRG